MGALLSASYMCRLLGLLRTTAPMVSLYVPGDKGAKYGSSLLLGLIASGLLTLHAAAQSPAFISTGSTTVLRFAHTATLLAYGRVLITGGKYPTATTREGPTPKFKVDGLEFRNGTRVLSVRQGGV